MDKAQILNLLGPFIRGEVPKNEQWEKVRMKIGDSLPETEIRDAINILKEMINDLLVLILALSQKCLVHTQFTEG